VTGGKGPGAIVKSASRQALRLKSAAQFLHKLFTRIAHSQLSAVVDTQFVINVMSGRGKGGKSVEECMLEAARHGWSGIPVWASDAAVRAVQVKYPEIFHRDGSVRHRDALGGSPGDAPGGSPAEQHPESDQVEDAPCDQEWLLRQGVSVVSITEKDDSEKWLCERYAVRQGLVKDICFRLQAKPDVDLFADTANHRFPMWYGEGGLHADAFSVQWTRDKLYWCNPPFSKLDQVVQKVKKDKCQMILVCPDWRNRWYFQAVRPHIVRQYYYAPGTHVFELPPVAVAGIRWGLWALLIDGELFKEDYVQAGKCYSVQEINETWQATSSAKRRRRRKGGQVNDF
jgi:hypothetical protein